MPYELIIFSTFMVFTGAALFASAALYARQSMLVAYILLGCLLGPSALAVVTDPATIQGIGHVGIIFLLYLLGLNLHPQKLVKLLREALRVTVVSSLAFAAIGFAVAKASGFGGLESCLIGAAMMFSSTIIGLKLLPTTALHHRHVGEVIISVLLLQDIIAILILLALEALARAALPLGQTALLVLGLPALVATAIALERWLLMPLLRRFDTIQEFLFLVAIGWCLGIAQLGHALGIPYEIGAFVAGVALATNPLSTFIAESLKPLRDFFLVMFFFSLGAGFPVAALPEVALPAIVLAAAMLVAKPLVFRALLVWEREGEKLSGEIGLRLGQVSEFALLIAVLATHSGVISERASHLIEATTVVTFVVSSYLIMNRYPTPIAVKESLRRD